jgi:hypothetical protein
MKKHAYLGTNKNGEYGCILVSLLSFDQLIPEELEASDFIHASSNWGGRDKVSETLRSYKARCTGRSISLENPLIISGIDYDTFSSTEWDFEVYSLSEAIVEDSRAIERYNIKQ